MSVSALNGIGVSNLQTVSSASPTTNISALSVASPAPETATTAAPAPAMLAQQVLGYGHVTPNSIIAASAASTSASTADAEAAPAKSTAAVAASTSSKPKATLAKIVKGLDKTHKRNGGKYDCWGMSEQLYKRMKKNGYKTRIIQFKTGFSPRHRQIQYKSGNKWKNFPYDKYHFDKLFRAKVPAHFGVLKHN